LTKFIKRLLPYKDIGWEEIGEEFTRFILLKTPFFTIYLHRLIAPNAHPECHDHPWTFLAILLKGGYWEFNDKFGWIRRYPGEILYRPAEFSHNVLTPLDVVSWSLVITGPKRREWGFTHACQP
jgi:hypothetical protein